MNKWYSSETGAFEHRCCSRGEMVQNRPPPLYRWVALYSILNTWTRSTDGSDGNHYTYYVVMKKAEYWKAPSGSSVVVA